VKPLKITSPSQFLKERAVRESRQSASWPALPNWRGCSVYLHAGEYVVIASNRLDSGVIQSNESIVVLPESSSDVELGQAVLDTLTASRSGVPHIGRLSGATPAWLKSKGFSSWKHLSIGSRCINIQQPADALTLTPMRGMPDSSMREVLEKRIQVSDRSPQVLGGRVREALLSSIECGVAKPRRKKRSD
jgi:hypothetical protein